MKDKTIETNVTNLGTAPAMANSSSMQVSAHSSGLLFSQMANQQQQHFQLGLSTSTMNVKKILDIKANQSTVFGSRRSRFFNIEEDLY